MEKRPEKRFESFAAIREAIGKHDFLNMKISDEDREIYQDFTNLVYNSLTLLICSTNLLTYNHFTLKIILYTNIL